MSGRGKPDEKRYAKPNKGALHVRLVPAMLARLRMWRAEFADGWEYNGQRLGTEGLVTALLVDFLDRSHEEQAAILNRSIPPAQEIERKWWGQMAELEAKGLIEPDPPYRRITPPAPKPRKGNPGPSNPGLEDAVPAGPVVVVVEDADGAGHPVGPRHRPKRRA